MNALAVGKRMSVWCRWPFVLYLRQSSALNSFTLCVRARVCVTARTDCQKERNSLLELFFRLFDEKKFTHSQPHTHEVKQMRIEKRRINIVVFCFCRPLSRLFTSTFTTERIDDGFVLHYFKINHALFHSLKMCAACRHDCSCGFFFVFHSFLLSGSVCEHTHRQIHIRIYVKTA